MKEHGKTTQSPNGCPFHGGRIKKNAGVARSVYQRYPHKLRLDILRRHYRKFNPHGENFNYSEELHKLDYLALKKDLRELMTSSHPWWPADFKHYGPLFIRLAWHSAGSYRIFDGRGGANTGAIRLTPRLNWPDNANLDKALRLLEPIKLKYGKKISWADLIVLAGNVALESMGFKTVGFVYGREDTYEPEDNTYWGPEEEWLASKRYSEDGELETPLAATQMGLIYVNPEGPEGNPDPLKAAKRIRDAFAKMGMNDMETVALIAGGHSFGKAHGAVDKSFIGPEPQNENPEAVGLGWINKFGKGHSEHTFTSGLEGAWTSTPTKWSHDFFKHLFEYEWELTKSPAGAWQWKPKNAPNNVPDAHLENKKHQPFMLTTDIALKEDPEYYKISKYFYENPEEFEKEFAKAWFKLIHRDMGPPTRYIGPEKPKQTWLWQDPLPAPEYTEINPQTLKVLKQKIINSDLSISDLMFVAWAAASTYRNSDKRGGLNGARIRLEPQINWEANNPKRLIKILNELEKIRKDYEKEISIADLIAFGSKVALEIAIHRAGFDLEVPFFAGRTDATYEHTDIQSFCALEPVADPFRNYYDANKTSAPPETWLIEKADLLTLNPTELTILYAGLKSLNINYDNSNTGILTASPQTLSNDFLINLLDMTVKWKPLNNEHFLYYGYDLKTGEHKWTASRSDLIFAHEPELRTIVQAYASQDAHEEFIRQFVKIWNKVINLDRF